MSEELTNEERDRKTRRRLARERQLEEPRNRAQTFHSADEYKRKPKHGNWADQEDMTDTQNMRDAR